MTRKGPDQSACGLLDGDTTHAIVGCFFSTYNILDYGLLESVYRRALALEMRMRGLHVQEEVAVEATYKAMSVGLFRVDLLVERRVIVELKATASLGPNDKRQLRTYLRAASLDVGLLLHYGPEAKFYRVEVPQG